MKNKFLTLALCAAMLLTNSTAAFARIIYHPDTPEIKITNYNEKVHTPQKVTAGGTVAHYFETTEPVIRYVAHCPSYSDNTGSLTLSLYKWAGDFSETLQTTPLASKRHVNFPDNSYISVYVEDYKNCTGALLAVLSNSEQDVGVWITDDVVEEHNNKVYVDGNATEGKAFGCRVYTAFTDLSVADVEKGTRDPYSVTRGASFDSVTEKMTVGSQVIGPAKTGQIAGYADMDFGNTPPKGLIMNINPEKVSDGDVGQVQIRADDPEIGQIIANVYFEYDSQIEKFQDIPVNIDTDITGVHDIYLIFYGFNYLMNNFRFTKEEAGISRWDKKLADFEPVAESSLVDYYSDTWSATDMMGRKLPGYETVGERDEDREITMFYWTWHANALHMVNGNVYNNEATLKRYLRKNPGGTEADIKNVFGWTNADGTTDGWGSSSKGNFWWNESVYGHYNGLDSWVMRKQMELLSAAEVDGLFFDATNGARTFTGGYMTLAKTLHEMQQEGIKTPKISFILPFSANENTNEDLRRIYQSMYKHGLYSDTWYYWDGKPVLMAYPEMLKVDAFYDDINTMHREIENFFTFRPAQSSYFLGQVRENQWSWLQAYPQHGFTPMTGKYDYEMVAVGTAQNASNGALTAFNGNGVYGRSYTYKDKFALYSDESKYYGYNFAEQWERALALNPKMVFITGWNEYTAGHYTEWMGVPGAFPDQYRDEYSRDIEPVKGDFKDNYYYQMVANIRRFKGVRETPVASKEKSITFSGSFTQFNEVAPAFYNFPGGTEERAFYGDRKANYYTNTTGRNDIVLSKVARDKTYLYFYVKTKENLTSHTDPSWMRLFINTDRTYKTGWEGYDFAVNITPPASKTSGTLSFSGEGWDWKTVDKVTYRYSKNEMLVRIPRKSLGLYGEKIDLEFKWIDNMQNQGDIMDVYNNGDSAPIGRFAYRYTESVAEDTTPTDEPVTVAQLKENQHKHSVIMAIGSKTAFSGGKQRTMEVAPALINEKTMIPLRFFSEGFGAEVSWDDVTKTATVTLGGNVVEITAGKSSMLVNGAEVSLESPAVVKNGRTLVPMRDIAEALGKKVLWIDGGLIIAGENPETVHSYEWVQDMTEDNYGIR